MKSETRILVIREFEDCRGHKLTFYVIMRGKKGIEHLEMYDGDSNNALMHLRTSGLMDEVRLVIDPKNSCRREFHGLPALIRQKIAESLVLLNALIREVNRLICVDVT